MEEQTNRVVIFRDMTYNEVREKIINGQLSVNIIVKLQEKYQKLYFESSGHVKICELTILHLAICLDDEEFVDYLLNNNADTNLGTENVGPVIFTTIRLQKLKYVRKLVDVGTEINKRISLWSLEPDRMIIRHQDAEVSERITNYYDYTPLEYAVNSNAYDIAEFLISRGAEVNYIQYDNLWDCASPLCHAAESNNIKMMELLMKHGADINFVGSDGYHDTPLLTAVTCWRNVDSVKLLLSQPTIKINSVDINKSSCLHLVTSEIEDDDDESFHEMMLSCLLDAGCDVNLVNDKEQLAVDIITEENEKYIMVIKKHIIKLIAIDAYVCARNAEVVSGTVFNQFRSMCNQEDKVLKDTQEPSTGFLYFDVLNKCQHKLALRLKNRDFDNFDHVKSKLPLYGGMIAYILEKAGQRCKLFNKVEKVLYEIFDRKLPATFIHEIFFYFSYADLLKLIQNN